MTGGKNSVILGKLARAGAQKASARESGPNLENDTEERETRKEERRGFEPERANREGSLGRGRTREETAKIPKSLDVGTGTKAKGKTFKD